MDESEAFRRAVERGAFAGMNKPRLWADLSHRTLAEVWGLTPEQITTERASHGPVLEALPREWRTVA